jgi:hypothetical protein
MSTLWLYGDSFTEPSGLDYDHDLWWEQLADKLGVTKVVNQARSGLPNSFIALKLGEDLPKIKPDDHVFLQLTDQDRVWLFEKEPRLSNFRNLSEKDNHLTKAQQKALKEYTVHFFNPTQNQVIRELTKFFALGATRANTRVLDAFDFMAGVDGTLVEVSINEYVGDTVAERQRNMDKDWRLGEGEKRPNHLSPNNHAILADKVYNWFTKSNYMLDLTTDFEKKFLTIPAK